MLQSIERRSGLPIAVDPLTGVIHWPEGVTVGETSRRTPAEMQPYIREPEAASARDHIYTVYRAVAHRGDETRINAARLRYDITVLSPGAFVGRRREFFRTAGHYHALAPGRTMPYPEVYEVLSGRACWLIQRPQPGNASILEEIYAVEAGPGEKAVLPPGFGHISVNVATEPLVMANWISTAFGYDYRAYRERRGGGYWLLEGPAGSIEFERNHHYAEVSKLEKLRPREISEFGLLRSRPLYALSADLEKLRFLSAPEEFRELLSVERCYRH